MYKVVGSVASRTFRVVWMLEELGQPYEVISAKPQSDTVRAYSPLGKIPVLVDGDAVIADSVAIMTYLADKHGALTAPAGTAARGQQDALTFRILDELDSVIWTFARHSFVLPEAERVAAVKAPLQAEFMRNLGRITDEIVGPFALGDEISIPDLLLVHMANWARYAGFPDPSEAFAAYAAPIRAREAYKKTIAQRKT